MGQVGVFSRGQILAAGELALYSDGGSGWGMAASATAPMWDTWNQQAKRSAAGPSAHAHYLPAPSGHLRPVLLPGGSTGARGQLPGMQATVPLAHTASCSSRHLSCSAS